MSSKFKAAVRSRMKRTGESYQAAHKALTDWPAEYQREKARVQEQRTKDREQAKALNTLIVSRVEEAMESTTKVPWTDDPWTQLTKGPS